MRSGIIAAIVAVAVGAGTSHPKAAVTEFVGTIPCGETVRAFVGGMAPGEQCSAVVWRIDLAPAGVNGAGWSLDATYGSATSTAPAPGPHVSVRGTFERSGSTYRLTSSAGKVISLRQIANNLLHVVDDQGRLMVGTPGWSYTLSRADSVDDRGQPEQIFGGSYSLMPVAKGNTVLGVFGGRSPCTSLLRSLRITLNDGCQRIKWRVTLFQDSVSRQPTTYRIEGSLHHPAREGTLHVLRGTSTDPNAVVYQLDATSSEGPMLLWKADDNVLFLLDEQKRPLVGTIDFSYTLSRTP